MFFTLGIFAQGGLPSRYNLTYLNMASGMPNNYVDDIFQDSKGFVWICTHGGGLVRYDGFSYLNFSVGTQGVQLRSNSCRNVCEDAFKRLWVAFEEGAQVISLSTMQPALPNCTSDRLTSQLNRLLHEPCGRIYCDTKEKVWLLASGRLYCIRFDANGAICQILSTPCASNAPDLAFKDLFGRGSVVVCARGVVNEVCVKGDRLVSKNISSLFPPMQGRYVGDMVSYNGKIWLATNAGLVNNGKGKNEYHCSATDHSLQHDLVSSLAVTPGNRLLVGTLCGVDIIDDKTGEIEHWNSNGKQTPLSSNFVNCLFSKNGQIWVGTETGGITKLTPRQLSLVNFQNQPDNPSSLSKNAVNAMYTAPDGTLWVGVVEGGLNRLSPQSNDFVHFTKNNSPLPHNSVSVLAPDASGNLWIGTWGGGVAVMPLKDVGKMTCLVVDAAHQPLLTFVGALVYDSINQGMWVGANEGLFFYNQKTRQLEEPFKECREIRGNIGSMITREGKLFMGCTQGMVVVDLKSRPSGRGYFKMNRCRYKLDNPKSGIFDKIQAFCQTRDGRIWIGSNGYGMYCLTYDKEGHAQFETFNTSDGLANNSVKGIVEDKKGMLWVATENGLSIFDPQNKLFCNFYKEDGLLSSQFYFNGAILGPGGTVCLGTEYGLTIVKGVNDGAHTGGKLTFTHLTVDNQEAFAGSNYLEEDVSIASEIRLHESDRSFCIDFSALNYGSEKQGVYSYRMKGFESDWTVLPPGQHSVRYSTLPSGNYEFMVKYTPAVGSGEEQTASINVHVTPYFWKSWWFVSLIIIGVIFLARYFYLQRLAKMREREVEALYRPLEAAMKESEDPAKLQSRIQTILDNQRRYQESQTKTLEEDKKAMEAKNRPFMQQVIDVLEKKYGDPEFGVQELADALGINRGVLSKKLNAETGQPTAQFIRNYRLDIARKMIIDNFANRNITEIAYRVGFNDPKYFTRCFTKQYGMAPSVYREETEK